MDISLTEEQQRLSDTAWSFAKAALTPARIRTLEQDERGFDPATWKAMAEMGWLGAPFPERYGGFGVGFTEIALIVEALGRGAIPSPFFSTVIEAGLLLAEIGSPAQKEQWLSRIAAGDAILTTAITEASGGLAASDIRVGLKGALLDGTKLFVRDTGAAEALIVLARSGAGPDDLTWVLVPCDTAGVSMRRMAAAGGEALWEVNFSQVEGQIVGLPSQAWPSARRLLERGAALKAAELVGIGQAALDLTVEYAKTRIQFDKPIGSFQAVHHHCANMYRDVELCRLLAWQAAAAVEHDGAARAVAMAKAKASAAIPAVTRLAHQIHGSIAFYRDYPLELFYNRAVAAKAAYGDALHHRRILSDMLRADLDNFRGENRHALPVHHL